MIFPCLLWSRFTFARTLWCPACPDICQSFLDIRITVQRGPGATAASYNAFSVTGAEGFAAMSASTCSKAIRVLSLLMAYLRRNATSCRGLRAMVNLLQMDNRFTHTCDFPIQSNPLQRTQFRYPPHDLRVSDGSLPGGFMLRGDAGLAHRSGWQYDMTGDTLCIRLLSCQAHCRFRFEKAVIQQAGVKMLRFMSQIIRNVIIPSVPALPETPAASVPLSAR
jgi:hypothetical protein